MKGAMDRPGAGPIARRMAALCLGISLAGCAAMTQDVDAYYRQMAVNYQEALDKAKIDEISVEHQAQVLAATGDKAKYRKYHRELGKIREWEERCAKEKKRFEKAAEWMESHFAIDKEKTEAVLASSKPPEAAPPADPTDTTAHDIKDSQVE
jgi:hypothetical protein